MAHFNRSNIPSRRLALAFLLAVFTGWALLSNNSFNLISPTAHAANLAVTNTNDSGAGSLRQAILTANSTPGKDTIQFGIGSGYKTIVPLTPLPEITDPVVLDATTQPGYNGVPLIELSGNQAPGVGLSVSAGGSTIQGFIINKFSSHGILLTTKGSNIIQGNYVGTSVTGLLYVSNGGDGISIQNGSGLNLIGGTQTTDRNVISGNLGNGILIAAGCNANHIRSNYVGLNAPGTAELHNAVYGIRIQSANNFVGGTGAFGGNASDSRNYVAGNEYGIGLEGAAATGNQIKGNYIGLNGAGNSALGNHHAGIDVNAPNNSVGGPLVDDGNVISGNDLSGVAIGPEGDNTKIQNNRIGTEPTGANAIANKSHGISVTDASGVTIGGNGSGNLISGNNGDGIHVEGTAATKLKVSGNKIGLINSAENKLPNKGSGVVISGTPGALIGGTTAGEGNNISGNDQSGVLLSGQTCTLTVIQNNQIGTLSSDFSLILGNQGAGVQIVNAPTNLVGGTLNSTGNNINKNFGAGVLIQGANATDNIVKGNDIQGLQAGVEINGASNNTIGGERNQIYGIDGIRLFNGATNNVVINNEVQGQNHAIRIAKSSNNIIGGTAAGTRNYINEGLGNGITIEDGSTENVVQGNYIGLQPDGDSVYFSNGGNGVRIVESSKNQIGGTTSAARNYIAGTNGVAVFLGLGAFENKIQGNYIGTDGTGQKTGGIFANQDAVGISEAFYNIIGGSEPGAGNFIPSVNDQFRLNRVLVAAGTGNQILGNSLTLDEQQTAIDLLPITQNNNDLKDADFGPNNVQNFPVLTSVVTLNTNTTFNGVLESEPDEEFRVEFFSSDKCSTSGYGPGQHYLGFVNASTDGNGHAVFSKTLPVLAKGFVTATATHDGNGTSEFSPCAKVGNPNPGVFQFASSFYLAHETDPPVTVTVSRSHGNAGPATVHYATSANIQEAADPGVDYTPVSGTLTFADGETSKTFDVPMINKSGQPAGLVGLELANPTGGATLGDWDKSFISITDHDPSYPQVTIGDSIVQEGNNGTTQAVFTIKSQPHTQQFTVTYRTADGTATAGEDYEEIDWTQITLAPGEVQKNIIVNVKGDAKLEPNEMFFIELSGAINANLFTGPRYCVILNDEPVPPSFTLDAGAYDVSESAGKATITVKRKGDTSGAASINYATSDGSATAGEDYAAASGQFNFGSGEKVKTFEVLFTNDQLNEIDETINLTLSNPSGGSALGKNPTATLTITNDDPPPAISINDVVITEGDGPKNKIATLVVSLSSPSGQTIEVDYETADDSAKEGSDYVAISNQKLVFTPGQTSKSINVSIVGDTNGEPDETFIVNLGLVKNALSFKNQGSIVIQNDDGVPAPGTLQFSMSNYTVIENGKEVTVTVTRSNGSSGSVSVDFKASNGTANEVDDFTPPASGTMNIANGQVSRSFNVQIVDDPTDEDDETFNLTLSNPTGGATLGSQKTATVTITDDDPTPSLAVNDVSVAEGNSGSTETKFTVTLSTASSKKVTVAFATADGSGKVGEDYESESNTLTFNPGETSKTISVPVKGDAIDEPDETFVVNLSNPSNATFNDGSGQATIVDDDPAPSLAIDDVSIAEGNSGSAEAKFTITLSTASNKQVTVAFATADGSGKVGEDYETESNTLTFNPGETSKTISVPVKGDAIDEPDETFMVTLSNPSNATLNDGSGQATIVDDDPAPSLSVSDLSKTEGNQATTNFDFEVTLSAASSQQVTVTYAIVPGGSALVGSDYQPTNGSITFAPGETTIPVTVVVNGDTEEEPDETFMVDLSNPTNSTLTKGQGTGTIINDDATAAPSVQFSQGDYVVQEDLGAVTLTVTRTGDTGATASVDYVTVDDKAEQKSDYEITSGTLSFAPGETSKTVTILINEDSFIEGNETIKLMLSNPSGAALGQTSAASIAIVDDVPETSTNPLDSAQAFVYTHYHDFLNREPDADGLAFWTNEITSCGNDARCIEARRINVSAAYFHSIEFQQTGYLLYLLQKETFNALPRYSSFMRDLQEVSQGVVVNSPGWEQKLASNQQQFSQKWVERAAFKAAYDSMSNTEYVNALYANAGVIAPQEERVALVNGLDTATQTRASALLEVAANLSFRQREQNSAFVLMQYFGYLRRDPDSAPDADLSGFYFWLNKLNSFNGDYQQAEMVKAFLDSSEYRQRFGIQ